MIALDTNLLIYAHRSAAPEHRAATKAADRLGYDCRSLQLLW
jgi:predicted nucleic acid-binding protein